ncbi:MAG: hypothetical protein MRZ54_09650 [Clostridiales bacterium]|nr:hypothetical protein [Clostridiales bacterium]
MTFAGKRQAREGKRGIGPLTAGGGRSLSYYEISPEKADRLARLLQKKTEAGCACYLQHHTGWDLIALLKEHDCIKRELHFQQDVLPVTFALVRGKNVRYNKRKT